MWTHWPHHSFSCTPKFTSCQARIRIRHHLCDFFLSSSHFPKQWTEALLTHCIRFTFQPHLQGYHLSPNHKANWGLPPHLSNNDVCTGKRKIRYVWSGDWRVNSNGTQHTTQRCLHETKQRKPFKCNWKITQTTPTPPSQSGVTNLFQPGNFAKNKPQARRRFLSKRKQNCARCTKLCKVYWIVQNIQVYEVMQIWKDLQISKGVQYAQLC